MSKQDRAAQVIYDEVNQTWERGEILTTAGEAERLANALAKAGLLAPDLPESNGSDGFVPGGKEWLPGGPYGPIVWTAPDSTVMVQRIEPGELTPDETRGVAYSMLAAANYSEGSNA